MIHAINFFTFSKKKKNEVKSSPISNQKQFPPLDEFNCSALTRACSYKVMLRCLKQFILFRLICQESMLNKIVIT